MSFYNILPQAESDLDECAEYIAEDNLNAALRLYDCADETYKILADNPKMGEKYPSQNPLLWDVRFFPISKFKHYLAFYRPTDDGVEIIRVIQTSKDIKNILL